MNVLPEIYRLRDLVDVDSENYFIEKIIRNSWWGFKNASVRRVQVNQISLFSVISTVESRRIARAQELVNLFYENRIAPFSTAVIANEEYSRVIFPPIVEQIHGKLVVIDGMHRIFAAFESGVRNVSVILVNPSENIKLPIDQIKWESIKIVSKRESIVNSINTDEKKYFRKTAESLDETPFLFRNKEDIIYTIKSKC